MADIVWSLLYRLPETPDVKFDRMMEMARLWAAHLRGPGQHEGPIVLLSNSNATCEEIEMIPLEGEATDRREIFAMRPQTALRLLHPGRADRLMQLDMDSLSRHPIGPMFDAIAEGQMRVAPSRLPLIHPQQVGHFFGPVRRRWYGWGRGWRYKIGVSASLTACTGRDWPHFMGRWTRLIERYRRVTLPEPRPGDQGYLNYLYAFGQIPMKRYEACDIHHLRQPDATPREQIEQARVVHFPLPDKLEHMKAWSKV